MDVGARGHVWKLNCCLSEFEFAIVVRYRQSDRMLLIRENINMNSKVLIEDWSKEYVEQSTRQTERLTWRLRRKLNVVVRRNETSDPVDNTFQRAILFERRKKPHRCERRKISEITIRLDTSPCLLHFFAESISKCLKMFTNGCCHELLFIVDGVMSTNTCAAGLTDLP